MRTARRWNDGSLAGFFAGAGVRRSGVCKRAQEAANDAWPAADASSARGDDRLETAFDALDVLASAPSAADAARMAAYVLERLIPSAHLAIGLYDIDADLLRFVVARHDRQDVDRIPLVLSSPDVLAVHACAGRSACLGSTEGSSALALDLGDPRGPRRVTTMCIAPFFARRRLRGVVQLADRIGRPFDASDAAVVEYVASRVGAVCGR